MISSKEWLLITFDWLTDRGMGGGREEEKTILKSYSSYHLISFYSISFHLISFLLKTAVFSDPPVSSRGWPMPYRWQYKKSDSYQWNNFGHVDNVAIGKLFCDVENLKINLVLKGTSSSRWEKIKQPRTLWKYYALGRYRLMFQGFGCIIILKRKSLSLNIVSALNCWLSLCHFHFQGIKSIIRKGDCQLWTPVRADRFFCSVLSTPPLYAVLHRGAWKRVIHWMGVVLEIKTTTDRSTLKRR